MEIHTPRMIDKENLLLAHEKSYVDRFFNNQLTDKERKRIGLTPWTESMIERTLFLVGGAMEATHHAIMYGGITVIGIWLEGRIMRTESLVLVIVCLTLGQCTNQRRHQDYGCALDQRMP